MFLCHNESNAVNGVTVLCTVQSGDRGSQ